jgi:hypothetical protein
MRNLEGGNAPKGAEKFKGFVETPEYTAKQGNIDQIKQMTPKELGELGKSVTPVQGEPVNKILLEQSRQVGERRQMMQMFSRILKMTPEEFGDFLQNQPNRDKSPQEPTQLHVLKSQGINLEL